ncbi:hypothetical protein LptCag_0998 [Leptospirillum ferriphilum]|uniref:Uncharacterized protein n=1 Tax=Leptospirillum ferriphilum TaxID=178606 RepID=A0A094WCL2_9BACT|nr:hypothetical protein LptCag_0998 [Leptospirillum ferriphilum]
MSRIIFSFSAPGPRRRKVHGRKTIQYRGEGERGNNWPDGQCLAGAEEVREREELLEKEKGSPCGLPEKASGDGLE